MDNLSPEAKRAIGRDVVLGYLGFSLWQTEQQVAALEAEVARLKAEQEAEKIEDT